MRQTMNSRCFTCTQLGEDPDLGERLTVITPRRVSFPHDPFILTASELDELRSLLTHWSANGSPAQSSTEADDAAAHD